MKALCLWASVLFLIAAAVLLFGCATKPKPRGPMPITARVFDCDGWSDARYPHKSMHDDLVSSTGERIPGVPR